MHAAELHKYIKKVLVPPDLVRALTTEEINEAYLAKLQRFNDVLSSAKDKELPTSRALREQGKSQGQSAAST